MNQAKCSLLSRFFSYDEIEGCMSPPQACLTAYLLHALEKMGANGNLMEIGVFKGRSAALISMFLKEKKSLHLIDPSLSDEVRSSVETHISNLNPSIDVEKRIVFDRRFSFELTKDVVSENSGSYSFIHIDGSHSVIDVYRDLELAHYLLDENGVVLCDDFFGISRPDVTEAIYKYIENNPASFKIVMNGYHKAVLVRADVYTAWWLEILMSINDFMDLQGRSTQLHLYSAPIFFPTMGLVDRKNGMPKYGGYFRRAEVVTMINALQKAVDNK